MMKVSYFYGVEETKPVYKEIDDVFQEIVSGTHKNIISVCRKELANGDKKKYDSFKKRLPAYTISCRTKTRKADTMLEYSGLIQGDIDKLDNDAGEMRDLLFKDKHVEAAFVSPSGKGVKLWIKAVPDATKHTESFLAAEKHFKETYNLVLDPQCKDVARLFFQTYDPSAKRKTNAIPIPLVSPDEVFFDATEVKAETYPLADIERAAEALKSVVEVDDYGTWIKIGMSLKGFVGDAGFTLWDDWSSASSKYNATEMRAKWDGFKGGAITEGDGGTLFFLAGDTFRHKTISAPPTYKEKETDRELHKDLLKPAGFVGDFAEFIMQNSKYPQPELTLGASLAYTGVMIGRKCATEENTRSNLFIAALGKTGSGKESCRYFIKKFDSENEMKCFGAEKVTGRAAIERVLAWRHSSLFLIDEFGLFMQAIFSDNAPKHAIETMTAFMEIYTSSGGPYFGQDKASLKEQERFEIDQPCCSIYGTSTPDTFWWSLNSGKIRDGSMNRFVVVNALPTRPERQRPKFLQKFPKALCDRAALFRNMSIDNSARGNVKEDVAKPNPEIIVYSEDAWKIFEKLEDECSRLSEMGATGAMWVRVAEHAKKIALINTIGDNKSEINAERAEYGCELMKVLTRNTCMDIRQNLADNEFERISKKVERMIRESGRDGITTSELTARTRFLRNSRQRREILEDLQAASLIVQMKTGSEEGRRPTERWFITDTHS
tara:strand:+ start:171 stop:2327 length:2157 start_codon:yes stop_codon:yes gene_type:complete